MGMTPIHGLSKTREYATWIKMKSRCYDKKNEFYYRYGGRGIRVCSRWLDSVTAFVTDMGPRPSRSHSIERINNNGNYTPKNCRWATPKEQSLNTHRARLALYKGKLTTLTEIAEKTGVPYKALYHRIVEMEWPVKDALSKPIRYYPPRKR